MASSVKETITHGLELVHEEGDLWTGKRRGTAFQVDFGHPRAELRTPIAGALAEGFSIQRRRPWSASGIAVGDPALEHAAVIHGPNEAAVRALLDDAELRAKLRTLLSHPGAGIDRGTVHLRSGKDLEETRHLADLAVEVAFELSEAAARIPEPAPAPAEPAEASPRSPEASGPATAPEETPEKAPAPVAPPAQPAKHARPTYEDVIHILRLKQGRGASRLATRKGVRIRVDSDLELRAYVDGPWPKRFAVHRRKHGKKHAGDREDLVSGSDHAYVEPLVALPEIRDRLRAVLELPRAWVGEGVVHVRLDRQTLEAVPRAADLAVSLADALGKALSAHPPSEQDVAPKRAASSAHDAKKPWAGAFRTALAVLLAATSLALLVGATLTNHPTPIGLPEVGLPKGLHFGAIAIGVAWLCDIGLLLGSLGRRLFASNEKLKTISVGLWGTSWVASLLAVPFLGVLPAVPMICGPLVELLASKPLSSLPPGQRARQSVYTSGSGFGGY